MKGLLKPSSKLKVRICDFCPEIHPENPVAMAPATVVLTNDLLFIIF
ncbi:MAG: hypothetical protein IPN68_04590 [Bacteroidetes bacterium]|nr:hypothetical protein [Bacteroidota bacterium]